MVSVGSIFLCFLLGGVEYSVRAVAARGRRAFSLLVSIMSGWGRDGFLGNDVGNMEEIKIFLL